ncbi:class I SAM-dependent methyltransferase [Opitutaceae bacterium]|nr:class I SAM-dependent methyltransferase [Opitutaceae bacterium]
MNRKESAQRWCKGIGVEIGAFDKPTPGISPIYIDKAREFAGKPVPHIDYIRNAYSLPIVSNSLDYIVASHVIEHCANPVKALAEFYRVTKPGGIIYIVVPDKIKTFDRNRPATPVDHMLEDFTNNVADSDPTHIHDFIYGIDWETIYPNMPQSDYDREKRDHYEHYIKATSEREPIDIHFHVFDKFNTIDLAQILSSTETLDINWEVLDYRDDFPSEDPNGILLVLKKSPKNRTLNQASIALQKLFRRNFPMTTPRVE